MSGCLIREQGSVRRFSGKSLVFCSQSASCPPSWCIISYHRHYHAVVKNSRPSREDQAALCVRQAAVSSRIDHRAKSVSGTRPAPDLELRWAREQRVWPCEIFAGVFLWPFKVSITHLASPCPFIDPQVCCPRLRPTLLCQQFSSRPFSARKNDWPHLQRLERLRSDPLAFCSVV